MAGPILPISDPSARAPPAHSVLQSSNRATPSTSLNSIHTQPPMMAPAGGSKDSKAEGESAGMSTEETWQSIEMTQSGIVDKPAGENSRYPGYPEYEEDERTGYDRFSNSSFDHTGKLWPEIRKMKVMTLRSLEGFGTFTDLSKGPTQYKFELQPGSYLRFVCITHLTVS